MLPGHAPSRHSNASLPHVVLPPLSASSTEGPGPNGNGAVCSPPHSATQRTAPAAPAAAAVKGSDTHPPHNASFSASICSGNRVDDHFDLPPALVACLVRHTDGQNQPLATPAIVERCLRDLQRRLMPWVPAERVFGSTAQPTVPIGAKSYEAAHQKDSIASSLVSTVAPQTTTTPQAGSYLAGSRVRLQLAKTTDIAAVVRSTPVLHLLFYAVDESESRPAALSQIAQEWRAALMRKGEGDDCLVLLVHSDLIAASEVASRLAEEAQESSGQMSATTSEPPALTESAPSLSTWGSMPPALAVSQARVDAAAGQLGKYYKELRDAKFLPQQMCVYLPNETPMRILERLRSAVVTQGARLRQALESCAAQKRLAPQDPRTKPMEPAAAKASTTEVVRTPARVSSPSTAASPAGAAGEALQFHSGAAPSTSLKPPVVAAPSPPPPLPKYWSVQDFWRCGYSLVVHYLQYGLVFDARAVLERLFLEYYNSSDDYDFVRAPVATLQRLGRVPNLFEAHRHASSAPCNSGYPKALETGAELLEGLLLVVSAEMTCSLLLGDTAAAMARYHTFMQVTREKFDEWSAAVVTGGPAVPSSPVPAKENAHGATFVHPATCHQFFLLQCYLSGLRMWWPISGLCRPRREAAASLTAGTPPQLQPEKLSSLTEEKQNSEHFAPFISLPLTTLSAVPLESGEAGVVDAAADVDNGGGGRAVSVPPPSALPVLPTTTEGANAPDILSLLSTGNDQPDPPARHDSGGSGVRYSITNASLAAASASVSSQSFRSGIDGFFSGPCGGERSVRRGEAGEAGATICSGELDYLLKSGEDTVQVATTYLVELATSTGLLAEHMEPEAVQESLQSICEAVDAGNAQVLRAALHHQRQLQRSCAEAATLLEHARDALATVARDLGYGHFSYAVIPTGTTSLNEQFAPTTSAEGVTVTTASVAPSPFANVEELSSAEQALRLWRVLTAMTALALRIGGQRRREFHLYAELAVTFLTDRPNVTANIVAKRLLPYIERQGWRRIEMFVRRLYVEARERLMRRAGLRTPGSPVATARLGRSEVGAVMSEPLAQLWPHVFPTDADYALYRECVLVLLSNNSGCALDGERPRVGDSAGSPAGVPAHGVAEDVVGSLDNCLFSACTRTERWWALVGVDALLMGTALLREPSEYPLEHFMSPLTVKVEPKATTTPAAVFDGDRACVMHASSITGRPHVLQANVDDVVQITLAAFCTINPLVRPAFPSAAEVANRRTREAEPVARFQLTLESRKDWSTDEEAVHEVSISDADTADYDEQTHRLRVSFTFPVCHAGLYRVRRLRLCNGSTWLAYYPQRGAGGSCGDPRGWASSLRIAASQAFATPSPPHAMVEPLFQPVAHSALLEVPEQRSSVHLQLTLPREAHCFADSVDYVTLDVELEDPLSISGPEAPAASADGSGGVMLTPFADSKAIGEPAAGAGKQSRLAEGDTPRPTAACACSFTVGPGNLLLPLSASRSGGQNAHHPCVEPCVSVGSESAEAHYGASLLRKVSVSSPALHCMLPAREDGKTNSFGNTARMPPSAPHLLAAVVLGTPSAHRPKRGSLARYNPGASFSSFSMAASGAGPPAVAISGGDGGIVGLNGSFAAQTSQPVDVLSLSRRGVTPRSIAVAHVLSTLSAEGHEAVDPGATGSTQRNTPVFQSLRTGSLVGAAAAAAIPVNRGATGATPTTAVAAITPGETRPDRNLLPQPPSSLHARRRTKALHTPSERGTQEEWVTAGDAAISEDDRGSRGAAAFLSGLSLQGISGGAPMTPALSPLRKISDDKLELVMVHPDTVIREDKRAAAAPHNARATAAATMAAARTVVPINLGTFLNNIPSPEVRLRTASTSVAAAPSTSVLRAENYASADPLRETVIQLLQDASRVVAPATSVTESEKNSVAVTHMRLRLPLLPLLTTPISAEALASQRPETVTSSRGLEKGPAPSAAVAANQARIAFTCLRGREPCTTTLSAALSFQAAIGVDYAFKHFQGRVYCLVTMKNLLRRTSLWLRGAVLRVLDTEPSYEIVRVCGVYNKLLLTEWKPQDELSILYELDLITSFRPVEPECAHHVQIEALYSSWHQTFLTTPPESRLVLHTMERQPTEVAADDAKIAHGGFLMGATEVRTSDSEVTQQGTVTPSNTTSAEKARDSTTSAEVQASALGAATTSYHHSDAVRNASRARSTSTHSSRSRSFIHATHTHCSAGSSENKSQAAASSAVRFNVATLRHLEETCNTMWGPVAVFRSKHLCVFSIVMHAESPWTMRFGAATNYVPPPLSTSLTVSSTTGGRSPLLSNAPRTSAAATAAPPAPPPHPTSISTASSCFLNPQLNHLCSSGGADGRSAADASFFGNAMVDQPSDFVFVAGEPVRFCVRLQPQAQNWPEDADLEETFFIRLKYNPEQWMVIGKQRDRRTLSLMEEVTVYFNAVPLLPPAPADGGVNAARLSGEATATSGSAGKIPPRQEDAAAENALNEDTDGDEDVCPARWAGRRQRLSARPLAGHAVKDEGILQTPTVEMFWERKKPATTVDGAANPSASSFGGGKSVTSATGAEGGDPCEADGQPACATAVMGEAVLIDVVQFRTWVRVRKPGH
ncbi:hypothetical protein LSCM1_05055 [Leishmania martiniquensis]|uniref:Uncharacterized protein n=1 Tax=Leishmania martiniquensis TaxID=1580590 RepID=A0A836KLT4_9TRYP|nr:hypothetical protein LSCM1_05055 [Leishmania martiniquensis]